MPRRRSPGSTRLQASGGKRLKHLMQAFQRYLDIPRLIEKAKISCKILSKGFLLSA